ncbi:DUF2780 domain-containing protein [Pyxidicoccus parkwayensis]|uniref:DUF2780 domain-containing protein n=1 Tax=Pyxidicoccus parkwayensis TaxID=2813578 RepID=A0ABX7NVS5_9BACT|nr:DUF2780 domain-containing protein [Pyxidicoccus parkwaysis]QSQ20213.1 DUF2780 domain-containing protein [Pyxidicoccus parkwaysis]
MDLIGQLSQQLGVNGTQAQGLAGSLLKLVQGTVQEKLGPDAAKQMGSAIPEMDSWQQAAKAAAPAQEQGGGGLMGALGGLMGGNDGGGGGGGGGGMGAMLGALGGAAAQAGEVAAVVSLLGRFNIDASKASLVAPLLLNFLKSRLDPGLVSKVLAVVPMLAGVGGGGNTSGSGGGLGGMLGGLMGGN